jgi:outer membrane protein insertion porin family/translocation and assembly module TamA
MSEAFTFSKHEQDRVDGRAFAAAFRACARVSIAGWLLLSLALGCSRIPPGRSAVDSVTIRNAKEVSAGDLEGKLATQASPKFLYLLQGVAYDYSVYDEAVLQRDMARLERAYRSNGFFDAHARVGSVRQVQSKHVVVDIVVDEGPPTVNRNVTVVGIEALPTDVSRAAVVAARTALARGKRFDEQKFNASKDAVRKALTDVGYAYATVDSDAEVDVGEHVADYGFNVVAGPRATFGPIAIVGLDPDATGPRKQEIPEEPLRRAIDIREGAPYSTADIDSAMQALLDLGVFSAVEITPTLPTPPPANAVVPLTVKVQPIRLRQITLGGGLELDEIKTDVHLVAGWEDHNFFGGLRDFAVAFRPGAVLYPVRIDNFSGPIKPLPEERLRVAFRQPGFVEARTTGFVRPEFNIFPLLVQVNPLPNIPVVGYREAKVPIGVDRTFWKRLYVALDYTFQVENPFSYVGSLDPALESVVLSFPELVAHLDFRDDQVRPHKGFYLANTFQVAGGVFGGTATDVRIQPEVRTYVPLARGVTFATRASVGFLWASNYGNDWNAELENSDKTADAAPADPDRVALAHDMQIMYFRGFFSGGPTTNRGFPLLGVSPHGVIPFLNPATASQQEQFSCDPAYLRALPADQMAAALAHCYLPAGGFTLWEFQNEVRADISGPLSGTVFCDMSDVSPREGDIRLGHLHLSCGIGIAYDTPVGPIRADIGYRIPPLQVLGYKTEADAAAADPVNGTQPTILGVPIALAIGIGEAF